MSGRSENIRFNVYLNDKQAGSTMGQLNKQSRILRTELNKLKIGSREWISKLKEVQKVQNSLKKVRAEIQGTNSLFSRMANGFNKYFGVITAGIASISGVVFAIKRLIQQNIELADSFSNVRKTTGMTKKQVRGLYSEFKKFETRTPRRELLKLAEEAGRLGKKSKKDILDFVEVGNQIKVALGDDLGGEAEVAIREVGKLVNIFDIASKHGVDFKKAMLMVGSSINEVSANSQAQAPFLINYMKRLSGIATQAGISADSIIGYAAVLDENGQAVEMSATAMGKAIINMYKDTETYAEIAGMSVDDFSKLLNENANEAFIKFLKGLNGNNDGLSQMAAKLDELGLDGARAVQVLSSLASSTDKIRDRQNLANKSLLEATSLTNEYNIKNENLAGNVEIIGRKIRAWFINSTLVSWLETTVSWIANFGKETKTATGLISQYKKELSSERSELEMLFSALERAGEGTEVRNNAIEKINELYGDYLTNLLTEKSTTDDIAIAYQDANKGLVRNITLKARENDIQTLVNQSLSEQKDIVDDIINDISKKKGDNVAAVALGEIYDIIEKIKSAETDADIKNVVGSFARRYRDANQNVGTYAENLNQFIKILRLQKTEQKELNKVTLFYNQLMKQLGDGIKPKPSKKPTKDLNSEDDSYTEKELKKIEDLNNKFEELRRAGEIDKMAANEREIAIITDKYAKLIKEAEGYDTQIKRFVELRDAEIMRKEAEQNEDYVQKKAAVIQKIQELGYEDREKEFESTQEMYDALIHQAELYGIDAAALERMKIDAQREYAKEEIAIAKAKNKKILHDNMATASASLGIMSQLMSNLSGLFQEGSEEHKALAIFQATIDAAQATLAAFKSGAEIHIAVGIAAAAAAAAFGIAQIAKIKSTKQPTFAKGGISKGASHAEGGIHMIDSKTGKKVGEMEGDEPYMILSKETYRNNRELINSLLDSSLNRGGEQVEWMQPGYYPHPDVSGTVANLRTTKFASGAVTNINNVYNQQQEGSPPVSNAEMISLMTEMRDEMRNLKFLKAVLDLDGTIELKDALSEMESLESNAGV
jgi:TP901 family phage tail tape measure protein